MPLAAGLLQQVRIRPRLTISTLVGLAVLPFLSAALSAPTRALIAWDVGTGLYLLLAWTMMCRGNVDSVRAKAKYQDDGAVVILILTVLAALASVAAILLDLIGIKSHPAHIQTMRLALVAATLLCSWCFVHTEFALHYAHEFYSAGSHSKAPGLDFPGNPTPDYMDFLYFSFVIGTTSQTADVTIESSPMRRLALVHGVIAFFFNTTLLALMVNVAAGLT